MFQSLIQDLQHQFRHGNMITRLIIINVAVFVITALTKAFAPSFYASSVLPYIAIPAQPLELLVKPWTIFTHMFVHSGGWHLIWNMLMLYWFGRIVGDLLNDRRIWPLYFLGAMAGAVAFILSYHLFSNVVGQYAVGASAGVMAIIAASGAIAPDYNLRLILIGDVRLKYVVAVLIFMDVLASQGMSNAGGAFAHLGGAALGFAFVYWLREGWDVGEGVNRATAWVGGWFGGRREAKVTSRPKTKMTVSHRAEVLQRRQAGKPSSDGGDLQSRVDSILEKIKRSGFDSLTAEEKAILAEASQKD